MWEDRTVLEGMGITDSEIILEVGCGSGEFTQILDEESSGRIVGIDADLELLSLAGADTQVGGDARQLPVRSNSCDLVICQALLSNLVDPAPAVQEFARVATDQVVAIEPDNSRVEIESTVPDEARLAAQAREAYLHEVSTNPTLGQGAATLFREAGLEVDDERRYEHTQSFEPPYSERAFTAARRKVQASQLDTFQEAFRGHGGPIEDYDVFREAWQTMGRRVVEQMQAGEYRRTETVPFYVVRGQLPATAVS